MVPFVATGRHRPHEVLLLVASVVAGIAFVLGVAPPSSLDLSMPTWVVVVWYWALLLSGAVGLVGAYWRGDIGTGLHLERAAMLVAGGVGLLYATALFTVVGSAAAGAGAYVAGYAVACVIRAVQITRDLYRLGRVRGVGSAW